MIILIRARWRLDPCQGTTTPELERCFRSRAIKIRRQSLRHDICRSPFDIDADNVSMESHSRLRVLRERIEADSLRLYCVSSRSRHSCFARVSFPFTRVRDYVVAP